MIVHGVVTSQSMRKERGSGKQHSTSIEINRVRPMQRSLPPALRATQFRKGGK
jgi:hypothetical protein